MVVGSNPTGRAIYSKASASHGAGAFSFWSFFPFIWIVRALSVMSRWCQSGQLILTLPRPKNSMPLVFIARWAALIVSFSFIEVQQKPMDSSSSRISQNGFFEPSKMPTVFC
ncbi:hypothetical protein DC365_07750 [Vibrio vulnificus]|nr:hypothetical protein DC365_07750 [Vibrio vulnificus]PWY29243.1 hypothetical protein VV97_12575 [Vibrio vulnificus]